MQAHVDAGADARGRDQRAPVHPAHIVLHRQARVPGLQVIDVFPVGGHRAIHDHPGRREDEHPGADRRGDLRAPGGAGDPGAGVEAGRRAIDHAARHDQHVRCAGGGEVGIGQHAQAGTGAHRVAAAGHALHGERIGRARLHALVHAAGGGEDLVGAAQVQRLDIVEHQDGHPQWVGVRAHAPARARASSTEHSVAKRPLSTVAVRARMSAADRGQPSGWTMSQVRVASVT